MLLRGSNKRREPAEASSARAGMGDNNLISGVEPIEPDKIPPLPGARQDSNN